MKIDVETKLDFEDVLLTPQRSQLTSRSQVDLQVDFFDTKVVPIIAANMEGVGTFEMAKSLAEHGMMTALVKHYSLDELLEFYNENPLIAPLTIYSMGMTDKDLQKFKFFHKRLEDDDITGPKSVCVDVANGYTRQFEDFCSAFAEEHPEYVLIAGNIVTPEQTDRLIECGVDVVKIGIGPGSVCTTRTMTGVGYPQLSAVMECSEAARDAGGTLISDGGCTNPGDIVKAFAAGADLVMLGGMLAGHVESGITPTMPMDGPPQTYIEFSGMASKKMQDKYNGGIAEYRSSEGTTIRVPYRGHVQGTLKHILGGLRSAATYIGAESISEFHRRGKFIRVNRQH
jgi:GMP reductase